MVANETKQSQELAKRLWAIANDLRGNMNAAKFQNYILGVIFYRYLSEHTENYMDDLLKNDGISYQEALADPDYTETVKEWSLEHLGYIMEPKNLWGALIDSIKAGQFSIEDFEKAINALVGSTVGQDSEAAFYKLFDDMNLQDKDLGREVLGALSLSLRSCCVSTIFPSASLRPRLMFWVLPICTSLLSLPMTLGRKGENTSPPRVHLHW